MDHALKKSDPVRTQPSITRQRSTRRQAFTYVEVVMVLVILPSVMIVVSGVYAAFIRDLPRTTRLLQENTTVLDLLRQINRDMDRATGLPEQVAGQAAGERLLLIAQPGRVVRYQFESGRVVRTLLQGQSSSVADEERLWRVPDAVIAWQPWVRDGRVYAIEVHSHLRERISGEVRQRLADARVFFVHAGGQESEAL